MNSQQELLDAINTISQKKERSFDTPATVLRVEGDTVWVHIDGGADETPCQKTINCEEGETVQVRISNGSAFLVGNASAPPTDDKTAIVAHFVAEQADEKATDAEEKAVEAIRSVEAISQTVEGKVDSGDSNVTDLSSTMYQNANGVNIFNDTLAVGDSYAHIDGDSFDIKQATTAGTIDDVNDTIFASFGREITLGTRDEEAAVGLFSQVYGFGCIASGNVSHAEGRVTTASGISSHSEGYGSQARGDYSHAEGAGIARGDYSHAEGAGIASEDYSHAEGTGVAEGKWSHAQNHETYAGSDYQTVIGKFNKFDISDVYAFIIGNGTWSGDPEESPNRSDALRVKWNGDTQIAGNVQDMNGNNKTPTILESSSISAATTSYTFTDDAITADSVIDIYDTIFGFAPTAMSVSAGSATITFPAQSSSHKIKLFVY